MVLVFYTAIIHKPQSCLINTQLKSLLSHLQAQTGRVPSVQVEPVSSVPLSVPAVWPHRPPHPALLRSGQDVSPGLPAGQAAVLPGPQRPRLRSLDRQATGREELRGGRGEREQWRKCPRRIQRQQKWGSDRDQERGGLERCRAKGGDGMNMWRAGADGMGAWGEKEKQRDSQWTCFQQPAMYFALERGQRPRRGSDGRTGRQQW